MAFELEDDVACYGDDADAGIRAFTDSANKGVSGSGCEYGLHNGGLKTQYHDGEPPILRRPLSGIARVAFRETHDALSSPSRTVLCMAGVEQRLPFRWRILCIFRHLISHFQSSEIENVKSSTSSHQPQPTSRRQDSSFSAVRRNGKGQWRGAQQ